MTNDIQKIIDNLDKTKNNLGKAKEKINEWSDEIGYQEELSDLQSKIWKELIIKPVKFSANILASGASVSQSMVDNSNKILKDIWDNGIDPSITTSGTASESMSGISFSAVTYSVNSTPPQSYIDLDKVLIQRNQQTLITQKLETIDPSLKYEYENAWAGLYMTVNDKTRSPMFLIREVIRRLYDHYAPDDKIMELFPNILKKEDVHRADKVNYIASIIDPWKKQTFLIEEKAFNSIYGDLSKSHKDGQLNIDETKGILYQANGLIKLLLDSLIDDD